MPSWTRGRPSRSSVETGTPGAAWLVPASMTGEVDCNRKSSATLVEAPQLARSLNACEAAGRAGVKVRTLVLVFTAVMVRPTPSLSYSSTWLVW